MKKGIIMEVNERFLTLLTPEGEFLRARKLNLHYEIGQEIDFFPLAEDEKKKNSFLAIFKGKIVFALASMLIILSIIPFYQNNQVYAYMSIDINPSIELSINKNYQVIEIVPYNNEGKQIVSQIPDWKKKDVHVVANDILYEIKKQGYMKNNHEVVIATVYAQEEIKDHDKLWEEEIGEIKDTIHKEDLDLIVVEGTQEERKKAKEKGLTTGLYKEKILNRNKTKSEEKENPIPAVDPAKQEETPTKVNPAKQEETPAKVNPAIQDEKVEAVEERTSPIPPGQVKKEEKLDKSVGTDEEVRNEQVVPSEQEKKNEQIKNNADPKEQKTNQKNNENKNDQSQQKDLANEKSSDEVK